MDARELAARARQILQHYWVTVCAIDPKHLAETVYLGDSKVRERIHSILRSREKTYHYVLPTHVLAKVADPAIDCRSIQAQSGLRGRFDAREFCKHVIVPFDQQNANVLGGSADPYVSNPLRVLAFTAAHRGNRRSVRDWEYICRVLEWIEAHPGEANTVLLQVLLEIRRILEVSRVHHPVPARVSYRQALHLIKQFLADASGGERPQLVVYSLLSVLGKTWNLYDRVVTAHVNAPDAPSDRIGDVTCYRGGQRVLGVDVKDRPIDLLELQNKVPRIREAGVTAYWVLTTQLPEDESGRQALEAFVGEQFSAGYHFYILDLYHVFPPILAVLGNDAIHQFLLEVGRARDQYGSAPHRLAWARLLQDLTYPASLGGRPPVAS